MKNLIQRALIYLVWKALMPVIIVSIPVSVLVSWNLSQFFTGRPGEWNPIIILADLLTGRLNWTWLATILVFVLLVLVGIGIYLVIARTPVIEKTEPADVRPDRIGLPTYQELEPVMGRKAALAKARASLDLPAGVDDDDLIVSIGTVDQMPIYIQHEDSVWVYAPQRQGKTLWLAVGLVIDAPGTVVATSTKLDLFMLTALMRAGTEEEPLPILTFDLQGMSGWPYTVRWNPILGCEDPAEALARGKAWAGAQPMDGVKGGDWFNSKAAAILGRYLHAAALENKSMLDVLRWANDFDDDEPLEILRRSSRAHGFAERLQAIKTSRAGETIDSVKETLAGLLEPLSSPAAMHMLTPSKSEAFNVDEFLESKGTLFLLTDGEESPVAPIVSMFANHVFRKAQKRSQTKRGGRLWPPLRMVLDEAVNTAAFENMASALSDSGGRGIQMFGFSQAFVQNHQRWGETQAQSIKGTSSLRILLPGLEELSELDRAAAAVGQRMVDRSSRTVSKGETSTTYRQEREPILQGYQIQQMDRGEAFIHYSNVRPTIIKLIPWWERPDSSRIAACKNELEELLTAARDRKVVK